MKMSYCNKKKWRIYFVKEVSSTMDEIKKNIYKENKNILLMSYKQNKGRGTKNNKWISQLGNLFVSIKLNKIETSKAFLINYITGIVILDTLQYFLKGKSKAILKWPNDILINNKKIAGILIECISKGNKIIEFYIGIGVNLKKTPNDLEYNTTSLMKEGIKKIPRKKILKKIIENFDCWEKYLNKNKVPFILKSWMDRSLPINSEIYFNQNNKKLKGIYKGIDIDGAIKIIKNKKVIKYYNLETIN